MSSNSSPYSSSINSLSKMTTSFSESNGLVMNFAFTILVIIVFLIVFQLGLNFINYFYVNDSSPYLFNGLVNGKHFMTYEQDPSKENSILIERSNNEKDGVEFTWSLWVFIEDLDYNKGKYRHSKLGNIAKVPAFKTLQMEQSLLKQIFWFAHRRGIIDRNPYIKAPKPHGMKNMEKSRRPAFTEDEWRIIYTELRSWVKEGIDLKQPRVKGKFASDHLDQPPAKRVNKMHQHQREMCRHYILFMGQSGLRPNEARQMRWRDIKTNPQNRLQYIYVRPTTKTGERDTYPIQSAFNTLDRLRSISRFAEPDDLVFVNYYGKVHTNFGKTFKSFLTDHNLLVDQLGRDRTIYSLRHMYATFRLERGDVSIEALAQNMGTSPKMIYDHYRHITTHRLSEQLVQIAPKENKAELDALN